MAVQPVVMGIIVPIDANCGICMESGTQEDPVRPICPNCRTQQMHYNCMVEYITTWQPRDPTCRFCYTPGTVGPHNRPCLYRQRCQWPGRVQRYRVVPKSLRGFMFMPAGRASLWFLLGLCAAMPFLMPLWLVLFHYSVRFFYSGYISYLNYHGFDQHNYVVRLDQYPDADSPHCYYEPRPPAGASHWNEDIDRYNLVPFDGIQCYTLGHQWIGKDQDEDEYFGENEAAIGHILHNVGQNKDQFLQFLGN